MTNSKDFVEEMEAENKTDEVKEALGASEKWEEVNPMLEEVHDFETNKELVGVYVGKQENVGDNKSNMYTIEKKDGARVGVWGSALLNSRFERIFIGEEVKIVYLGKEKSKKTNRNYRNYSFYHRPVVKK